VAYSFSARKIGTLSRKLKIEHHAKKIAGSFMIGAGCYLIAKGL